MKETVYLVAGGDLRQVYLAQSLAETDKVYAICFDEGCELDKSVIPIHHLKELKEPVDCIVLPLPVTNDGILVNAPLSSKELPLTAVLEYAEKETLVFGGRVERSLKEYCARHHIHLIDYFEREELTVLNAVPTAEGAIQLAMEEMPVTIYGASCLVSGFGRISKVLVKLLVAMGAKVTVAARRFSDLSWAEIYGCKAVHINELAKEIPEMDLIVNTVPTKLLDYSVLSNVKGESLIIDLASKPGGVDFDLARQLGLNTIWALSLPGKVAPVSSGRIISQTLRNIIRERSGCE